MCPKRVLNFDPRVEFKPALARFVDRELQRIPPGNRRGALLVGQKHFNPAGRRQWGIAL